MQIPGLRRSTALAGLALGTLLSLAPVQSYAVSKETIQMQTQIQQLLDMVQRLQTTMDTKFAVLQNLAQQTADQATQMNGTVTTLQQKLNTQMENLNGKLDTSSGQVQSLNDSVDELKTRIAALQKSLQDMQTQLQNVQQPQTGTPGMPPTGSAPAPNGPGAMNSAPAVNQAPPLDQTYQAAVSDFNSAKYPLATSEFQDVVHYYPLDPTAGNAQFYLGEIAYRQHNYDDAVKAYNMVLEQYSGSSKASTAQLHKGLALISLSKRDAGVHELRTLIQRHPQTPEAQQARAKLNAMGVRISSTQR
ncbi:MAG TPA: tetratricopeptide repeat protein [Terracidiphilus sp.]|jgi:tol-pal system protein YbgF|nr:tetratricopeptide repeat protein [Terracidiphilus sp.]